MTTMPNSRNWYYEKCINSDRLLITVGDSWTWGDSLGPVEDEGKNDDNFDYRTTHIYGALLANRLNSDFVNMAIPGGSNVGMHDNLKKALPQVINNYKQIDVIINLTENGREIADDPIWTNNINFNNLNSFLLSYEETMLNAFNTLFNQYPTINFILSRNFTFTFNENLSICGENLLEKNWVEILELNQKHPSVYPKTTRMLTIMAIEAIISFMTKSGKASEFKRDLVELFIESEIAISWLDHSELNNKHFSRHPTEKAHKLWADYLYTAINKY